jgi:hypothetical protein
MVTWQAMGIDSKANWTYHMYGTPWCGMHVGLVLVPESDGFSNAAQSRTPTEVDSDFVATKHHV